MLTFTYCIWEETDQKAEKEFELQKALVDEQATAWFIYRALDQPGAPGGASFAASFAPTGTTQGSSIRQLVGEEAFLRTGVGHTETKIIGGYDTVAEKLRQLYDWGMEGMLFAWIDPLRGIHQLEDHVIPRLKKLGLRK